MTNTDTKKRVKRERVVVDEMYYVPMRVVA